MTRRLRPRGTTAAPIESDWDDEAVTQPKTRRLATCPIAASEEEYSDWDDELGTCPGCQAIIYGNGKCCTPHVFTAAAYATTADSSDVRSWLESV